MKEWIISVCAISILSVIIVIILPNGKGNDLVKKILMLICLTLVINPILSLDFDDISYFNNEIVIDTENTYFYYIKDKKATDIKDKIKKILDDNNISNVEMEVNVSLSSNYQIIIDEVSLNFKNSSLNGQKLNKNNIENIIIEISSSLNLELKNIIYYE